MPEGIPKKMKEYGRNVLMNFGSKLTKNHGANPGRNPKRNLKRYPGRKMKKFRAKSLMKYWKILSKKIPEKNPGGSRIGILEGIYNGIPERISEKKYMRPPGAFPKKKERNF